MNTSARDPRRVVGAVLLAAAGAYVLLQPFGLSPGACVGSLSGFRGGVGQAIGMCVAASAPLFVAGSVVGLVAIVAALWMLLPGPAGSRTASLLFAGAVLAIVGAGAIALATSPGGPFRTFAPTQTGPPAQTTAPTNRP